MPEFKLGKCSVNLQLERLTGPLSGDDRQVAWRLFLVLSACPELRRTQAVSEDLRALVRTLVALIEPWPAGQVQELRPGHLGPLVTAVVEWVLIPCIGDRPASAAQWEAVQIFCARLADEVARIYGFPNPVAEMPDDLRAAWSDQT